MSVRRIRLDGEVSRRAGLGRVALWMVLALGMAAMWVRFGVGAATTLLTIISGAAAATEVLVRLRWRATHGASSTADQIRDAQAALAHEIRNEWEAEAARRKIQDSGELDVRWNSDAKTGNLHSLIRSFSDQPRRLIVIGDAGSGKTGLCVLLALEILGHAEPEKIPVILQASAWNPSDHLQGWIIRTLLEQYPFLGNEARYGPTAVRELVRQNRILPILDALDEMPEGRSAVAFKEILRDTSAQHPWVIACRTSEFETADAGRVMHGVEVVRLLPIDADAAASYLLEVAAGTDLELWEPVLTELALGGDRPIVQALKTPLMLFLARTSYAETGADPQQLLDFFSARQIQERLLDSFVRQAFEMRPPSPLRDGLQSHHRWNPDSAERWLAYLAGHCGREIAWWEMRNLVPRSVFVVRSALVGALGCTPLGWLLFGLFARPVLGIIVGLIVGVVSSVGLSLLPSERPRRFAPQLLRRQELSRDLVFGLIGAVVGGLAVGLLYGAAYGIVIGLVFGLTFGAVRRFTEPTEPSGAVTPTTVLSDDRKAVLYAAGLGATVGAGVGAVLGGVVGVGSQELVILTDDPILLGLLGAIVGAVVGGGGLGLVVQATSAWGRFITTRIWLALRRSTPLELMQFMDDAHRLGILRQVGPYYQFRHALLQDRLALKS